MPGGGRTPREKLRDQLEQSARDLAALPEWIRETPPAFGPPASPGAVDVDACPRAGHRRGAGIPCRCGLCLVCGFPKHSAVHGPAWGEPPGSRPWGHEFRPAEDGDV